MMSSRAFRRSARSSAFFALLAVLAFSPGSAAQAQQSTATKSFLWKVQPATGSTVLYLAGSVHALTRDVYPLSPAFERAFTSTSTLIEEINFGELDLLTGGAAALAKGIYLDGQTLDRAVSKETFALVAQRLQNTGVPVELVSSMKPWMVAMMLTAIEATNAGLDANLGLDKYFFDKATAAGKGVKGLETVEYQIDRFDKMSLPVQEQLLRSTLADLDTGRQNLKAIVDAWRQGDVAALERILLAGFKASPAAYASLITERNRNWLPQIEACLARQASCFVVVGAAHLVGPDGLIALLQRKGYRVEQQ